MWVLSEYFIREIRRNIADSDRKAVICKIERKIAAHDAHPVNTDVCHITLPFRPILRNFTAAFHKSFVHRDATGNRTSCRAQRRT